MGSLFSGFGGVKPEGGPESWSSTFLQDPETVGFVSRVAQVVARQQGPGLQGGAQHLLRTQLQGGEQLRVPEDTGQQLRHDAALQVPRHLRQDLRLVHICSTRLILVGLLTAEAQPSAVLPNACWGAVLLEDGPCGEALPA